MLDQSTAFFLKNNDNLEVQYSKTQMMPNLSIFKQTNCPFLGLKGEPGLPGIPGK